MTWDKCLDAIEGINDHYSMSLEKIRPIFDLAMKLPERSTILELGVCNGRTAAMLCWTCKFTRSAYCGIDHFGLENTAEGVRAMLKQRGLVGMIVEANTCNFPWRFPIDLLIVDAGHDEANVKPDVERYLPFVKSGGIVVFDDYDDPYDPESAHWAVRFYADKATEGWERLPHAAGTLIVRKR